MTGKRAGARLSDPMGIRAILVGASGGGAGDGAIEVACELTKRFQAHLEGFHVRVDLDELIVATSGGGIAAPVGGGWVDQVSAVAEAKAAKTRATFAGAVQRHGIATAENPPCTGPSAAWSVESGYPPLLLARRARFFDLLVLGRSERVVDLPHSDAIEETLIRSGRPVLLAPAHVPSAIGNAIAIGWNGSSQAVRALAASLPFLAAAQAVVIITVGDELESAPAPVLQYLGWHGLAAEVRVVSKLHGASPGQQLLAAARDEGADLLVMGGYSHTPWRQSLFGGATREVLRMSLLPLLISH